MVTGDASAYLVAGLKLLETQVARAKAKEIAPEIRAFRDKQLDDIRSLIRQTEAPSEAPARK